MTNIVCLSGGHTVTFSYPLTAGIVSSVPSPTVYHTILQLCHEKAIYKQWRLTICTGLIKFLSSELTKKKGGYKQGVPFNYVQRAKRGRCWKMIEHLRICRVNLHTEKLCPSTGFKITNSHSPLHFPIRYMQKKPHEPEAQHSSRGSRWPLFQGKSYLDS